MYIGSGRPLQPGDDRGDADDEETRSETHAEDNHRTHSLTERGGRVFRGTYYKVMPSPTIDPAAPAPRSERLSDHVTDAERRDSRVLAGAAEFDLG
jgi:hypothetical protein